MSTEVTLGQVRNRLSTLFATKSFRPDLPLSSILTPDELQALLNNILQKGEPDGTR